MEKFYLLVMKNLFISYESFIYHALFIYLWKSNYELYLLVLVQFKQYLMFIMFVYMF